MRCVSLRRGGMGGTGGQSMRLRGISRRSGRRWRGWAGRTARMRSERGRRWSASRGQGAHRRQRPRPSRKLVHHPYRLRLGHHRYRPLRVRPLRRYRLNAHAHALHLHHPRLPLLRAAACQTWTRTMSPVSLLPSKRCSGGQVPNRPNTPIATRRAIWRLE